MTRRRRLNRLASFWGLFVIARNSTSQFMERAVDVREVASMPGVLHVFE